MSDFKGLKKDDRVRFKHEKTGDTVEGTLRRDVEVGEKWAGLTSGLEVFAPDGWTVDKVLGKDVVLTPGAYSNEDGDRLIILPDGRQYFTAGRGVWVETRAAKAFLCGDGDLKLEQTF